MAAMTRRRANSSVEYRNLHVFLCSVIILCSAWYHYYNRNIFFAHKRLKKPSVLVLTAVRYALLYVHFGLIFHCRNSGKSNRIVPQKAHWPKWFLYRKKGEETSFSKMSFEGNSVYISPRYGLLNSAYFKHFIEESAWKFRRFFFCGIFDRRKYTWKWIYEDSTSEGK